MSHTLPLVALGGAIGSVLRALLIGVIGTPWGTAAVNVLGSFVIGVLFVLLDNRTAWQFFLMTGLLGGFTTFSAFSLDTLKLIQSGQTLQAGYYATASVILSIFAVTFGVAFARSLT